MNFEQLGAGDVVSKNVGLPGFGVPTCKASELLQMLKGQISGDLEAWVDGVECEVLVSGKTWAKGKVKLNVVFCPDEPPANDHEDVEWKRLTAQQG